MNLSKSYDYFQPEKVGEKIHIIGCGSVGSTVAENLARIGITNFVLWDFDCVEAHNIVNQMFRQCDIGKPKVEALADILLEINPEIADSLEIQPKGWNGKLLSGYIFLCVDNIELRRKIVEQHMDSPYVKAVFDFRTGLECAQHYAADWSDRKMKQNLLNSMQFSHDEAAVEAPISACGVTLGVVTTVRIISALGVCNFINFVKGKKYLKKIGIVSMLRKLTEFNIDAESVRNMDRLSLYTAFYTPKHGKGMETIFKNTFDSQGRYIQCDASKVCGGIAHAIMPLLSEHEATEHQKIFDSVEQKYLSILNTY